MSAKQLKDLQFDQVVDLVAEKALASLVRGTPWRSIIFDAAVTVSQWNSDRKEATAIGANTGAVSDISAAPAKK